MLNAQYSLFCSLIVVVAFRSCLVIALQKKHENATGAPNDGFFLNALKRLLRLGYPDSRVLLDL